MTAANKHSKSPVKVSRQDGFTLLELIIATAVVGIMAAVAVPQYSEYKARAYDASVQSDLRSTFTTCQGYWTFYGSGNPCLLSTISDDEFGFTPSADVKVTIDSDDNNTEYDFYATASHSLSSNSYAINYKGEVTKISIEVEDQNSDENKDDGKKGRGCSEQAHKDPKSLGGNAAGGCGTAGGNNSANGANNSASDSASDPWWKKWTNQWWK